MSPQLTALVIFLTALMMVTAQEDKSGERISQANMPLLMPGASSATQDVGKAKLGLDALKVGAQQAGRAEEALSRVHAG